MKLPIHANTIGVKNNRYTDHWHQPLKKVLLVMKLTLLLSIGLCIHAFGRASAQSVDIDVTNTSFKTVVQLIQQQTGYSFILKDALVKQAKPVTLAAKDKDIVDVLPLLFANQPFSYQVTGKIVSIVPAQQRLQQPITTQLVVRGRVVDSLGNSLQGASVRVLNIEGKRTTLQTTTDRGGHFLLRNVPEDASLEITYVGYLKQTLAVQPNLGSVTLKAIPSELEEVEVMVNTGYQQLPKERATGSFSVVDRDLIESNVAPDILTRIEGLASSLVFDDRSVSSLKTADRREMRIRGISTINSDESPLIVLDNFPYEGDITNINPNDVESVTILKDAAAASIWGARAGNGVIVITTKNGKYDRPTKISFNSSINVGEKPDLYWSPNYLTSPGFIEFERLMFDRGAYVENDATPLSPVVEFLMAEKNGMLSPEETNEGIERLKTLDVRKDASKYLYKTSEALQNYLSINGGTTKLRYYTSFGYDSENSNLKGMNNRRLTLNTTNTYRPIDKIELSLGISYIGKNRKRGGYELYDLRPANNNIYPYAQLADKNGEPLALVKDYRIKYTEAATEDGLLDWQYRPLEELALSNQREKANEIRLSLGADYEVFEGLKVNMKYQYQHISSTHRGLRSKNGYSVRNLVNRFTQDDGKQLIPNADILDLTYNDQIAHYGRGQINYSKSWNQHQVYALAGGEVRQFTGERNGYGVYGFDNDVYTYQSQFDYTKRHPVRPRGTALIPSLTSGFIGSVDRYVSYFANISYDYKDRYILSASARKDASNLFGVNSNQKGVPLWSLGANWIASRESFYNLDYLSYLKLRFTYGFSGNVNKSVTAFTTAAFLTDAVTGYRYAALRNPGNPELRWEKVKTLNMGVDFGTRDGVFNGVIEYYVKNGIDLIGNMPIDPTTGAFINGIYTQRVNYANLRTKGLDIELSTKNIDRQLLWRTVFLGSYVKDRVTNLQSTQQNINTYVGAFPPPILDQPLNRLYSYPWYGLNGKNGNPQVLVEGEYSEDYVRYLQGLTPDDLIYHGSTIPVFFGSVRNIFEFKGISLSANITWKAGYYFRRPALSYSNLINNWDGHAEFDKRWKQGGDEQWTNVPSFPSTNNTNRDLVYRLSELTAERGDHIRLQDINVGYTFKNVKSVNSIHIYCHARRLGVLWKATKTDLDPDFASSYFQPPKSIAFGVRIEL